jgi:dihydrolipoamide dehydrogenase
LAKNKIKVDKGGIETNDHMETAEVHIFAHPTMSEMMHEAVLDAYGKVIHF